ARRAIAEEYESMLKTQPLDLTAEDYVDLEIEIAAELQLEAERSTTDWCECPCCQVGSLSLHDGCISCNNAASCGLVATTACSSVGEFILYLKGFLRTHALSCEGEVAFNFQSDMGLYFL
ncbi:hypothetical protein HDU91_003383, partial [Kappamyces sp. JEL0680]